MFTGSTETIDPKEIESLRTELSRVQKVWRQRRSQCREMVGNLAEGMDKKDSEVIVSVRCSSHSKEMIGLETEEELGIPLPFKKWSCLLQQEAEFVTFCRSVPIACGKRQSGLPAHS